MLPILCYWLFCDFPSFLVSAVYFFFQGENDAKLNKFIDTINGREGTGSHLVSVPPGPMLSEALVHSPIVAGEDGQPSVATGGMGGAGFGFDFNPEEDPELALVSSREAKDIRLKI